MSYLKTIKASHRGDDIHLYLDFSEYSKYAELGIVKCVGDLFDDSNIFTDWLDIKSLRDVLSSYVEILDEHIKKGKDYDNGNV